MVTTSVVPAVVSPVVVGETGEASPLLVPVALPPAEAVPDGSFGAHADRRASRDSARIILAG